MHKNASQDPLHVLCPSLINKKRFVSLKHTFFLLFKKEDIMCLHILCEVSSPHVVCIAMQHGTEENKYTKPNWFACHQPLGSSSQKWVLFTAMFPPFFISQKKSTVSFCDTAIHTVAIANLVLLLATIEHMPFSHNNITNHSTKWAVGQWTLYPWPRKNWLLPNVHKSQRDTYTRN